MGKIRYLLSNINSVNVLLAGILIVVAYFTFFPGSSVTVKYKKPVTKKNAAAQKPGEVKRGHHDEKNPFPTDYMVIAEENLFHPDRKIPEQKQDQKEAAPLPKPDFVLDGTLITDDLKMAFMEDKKAPVNTPGRPNRQTPLRIGESLSGYILKEIDKDQVVMQRGEEKMVVALEGPEKGKTRHYSQTTANDQKPKPVTPRPGTSGVTRPTPPGAVQQGRAASPPAAARKDIRKNFFNIFRGRNR